MFRKWGLIRAKLVIVCHHLPYTFLKKGEHDAVIFFSQALMDIAVAENPGLKGRAYVNLWGPDIPWYERNEKADFQYGDIIDNGKCNRNSTLLKTAAEQVNASVYSYFYESYNGNSNKESDKDMLKRVSGYKVLAVPIVKKDLEKNVVCGLTSFMDAIALGMPVLVSDNICFADEVVDNGLGLIYRTDDLESLKNAISRLLSDKEYYEACSSAMKEYRKRVNISAYSRKLGEIFHRVLV